MIGEVLRDLPLDLRFSHSFFASSANPNIERNMWTSFSPIPPGDPGDPADRRLRETDSPEVIPIAKEAESRLRRVLEQL